MRKPRLGFLGVGWIGRSRMESAAKSGTAEIAAIADASEALAVDAATAFPKAAIGTSLEELLSFGVDAVVIATPSALHAQHAELALRSGVPVFCQKPLGRNGAETTRVIEAARKADRLLGVDLSYRHVTAMRRVHELCKSGALGRIYAADLVFHNAYGPDKAWFYDPKLAGGGCLVDLGIHLVDVALWNLGFPKVSNGCGQLFSKGKPLQDRASCVEDYVEARLELETGACLRVACSWKLPAGREAVIHGSFYGTAGGASFYNVNGSFYEFAAEHYEGTSSTSLSAGPEDWGGRALAEWVNRLSLSDKFDPSIETLTDVAEALDSIYAGSINPASRVLQVNFVTPDIVA